MSHFHQSLPPRVAFAIFPLTGRQATAGWSVLLRCLDVIASSNVLRHEHGNNSTRPPGVVAEFKCIQGTKRHSKLFSPSLAPA